MVMVAPSFAHCVLLASLVLLNLAQARDRYSIGGRSPRASDLGPIGNHLGRNPGHARSVINPE
jgi:hypothetical protein